LDRKIGVDSTGGEVRVTDDAQHALQTGDGAILGEGGQSRDEGCLSQRNSRGHRDSEDADGRQGQVREVRERGRRSRRRHNPGAGRDGRGGDRAKGGGGSGGDGDAPHLGTSASAELHTGDREWRTHWDVPSELGRHDVLSMNK
jgi:hypothetical protein